MTFSFGVTICPPAPNTSPLALTFMLPTACTDSFAAHSLSMSAMRPCMVLYILFLGALATIIMCSYIDYLSSQEFRDVQIVQQWIYLVYPDQAQAETGHAGPSPHSPHYVVGPECVNEIDQEL